MAQKYSPTMPWPRIQLVWYRHVLSKDGLHYTFPTGCSWVSANPSERKAGNRIPQNLLVKPYYKGYTVRAFIFAGQLRGKCSLGVLYFKFFTAWEGHVKVIDGVAKTYNHQDSGIYVGEVKVGEIYNVAIGTHDQKQFEMSFNQQGFNKVDMKNITDDYNYYLWGGTGPHSLLSLHFYNALALPTPYLGNKLYLDYLELQCGTYGTYVVVYAGHTEAVTVHVKGDGKNQEKQFIFQNNGRLRKNDTFHCEVRKTIYGIAVLMSFDPTPQYQSAIGFTKSLQCHFSYGSIKNAHITAYH